MKHSEAQHHIFTAITQDPERIINNLTTTREWLHSKPLQKNLWHSHVLYVAALLKAIHGLTSSGSCTNSASAHFATNDNTTATWIYMFTLVPQLSPCPKIHLSSQTSAGDEQNLKWLGCNQRANTSLATSGSPHLVKPHSQFLLVVIWADAWSHFIHVSCALCGLMRNVWKGTCTLCRSWLPLNPSFTWTSANLTESTSRATCSLCCWGEPLMRDAQCCGIHGLKCASSELGDVQLLKHSDCGWGSTGRLHLLKMTEKKWVNWIFTVIRSFQFTLHFKSCLENVAAALVKLRVHQKEEDWILISDYCHKSRVKTWSMWN